jgi:SpoU rRNA methylase family enzyme
MSNGDYEVKWLIENRVALYVQHVETTLDNVEVMINAINDFIASSPQNKVPIIADVKRVKGENVPITGVIRRFQKLRSDKWGFTIAIGAQGIVTFLAQLLFQLGRVEVRFAKDLDEALDILYRMYPDLRDSSSQ